MRINVVDVKMLADQHLRAEYNEIYGMMPAYYRRSVVERKTPFCESEITKEYTMGRGHAKFFYNKMKFIENRWNEVRNECLKRGFVCNLEKMDMSLVRSEHYNDWHPTKEDVLENLARIEQRISTKPTWYKMNKESKDQDYWNKVYKQYKISIGEKLCITHTD